MRNSAYRRLPHAVFVATLLLPAAAAGQGRVVGSPIVRRADELRARADALVSRPDRHAEAAELLRQAARLRPAGNSTAIAELRRAARLYACVGDRAAARDALRRAIDRALKAGDVVTARNVQVDAAFLNIDLDPLRG